MGVSPWLFDDAAGNRVSLVGHYSRCNQSGYKGFEAQGGTCEMVWEPERSGRIWLTATLHGKLHLETSSQYRYRSNRLKYGPNRQNFPAAERALSRVPDPAELVLPIAVLTPKVDSRSDCARTSEACSKGAIFVPASPSVVHGVEECRVGKFRQANA